MIILFCVGGERDENDALLLFVDIIVTEHLVSQARHGYNGSSELTKHNNKSSGLQQLWVMK